VILADLDPELDGLPFGVPVVYPMLSTLASTHHRAISD
jgi:hypothetical protein